MSILSDDDIKGTSSLTGETVTFRNAPRPSNEISEVCGELSSMTNCATDGRNWRAMLAKLRDDLATLTAERDALLAEVERLTDSMSMSEAKAHEDAAELRVKLIAALDVLRMCRDALKDTKLKLGEIGLSLRGCDDAIAAADKLL